MLSHLQALVGCLVVAGGTKVPTHLSRGSLCCLAFVGGVEAITLSS
jgi:hypothetical protein